MIEANLGWPASRPRGRPRAREQRQRVVGRVRRRPAHRVRAGLGRRRRGRACTCTPTCSPSIPDRRHRGVGEALKLAQRAQALDQGIDLVRWTFDPLVARNAWLNLGKLGAVIDRFARSFYGDMTDSINAGERSDRRSRSRGICAASPGRARRPASPSDSFVRSAGEPRPMPLDDRRRRAVVAIEVPREYARAARRRSGARGSAWREAIADALERCLVGGTASALAFDRDSVRLRASQRPSREDAPREPDQRDRAVPDRAAARAAVPRVVRYLDREAVRARARAHRRAPTAGASASPTTATPGSPASGTRACGSCCATCSARRSWRAGDVTQRARSRTQLRFVRGNPMAKATLDRRGGRRGAPSRGPVARVIARRRPGRAVACGVSIGIADTHRRASRARSTSISSRATCGSS